MYLALSTGLMTHSLLKFELRVLFTCRDEADGIFMYVRLGRKLGSWGVCWKYLRWYSMLVGLSEGIISTLSC